MRSWFKTTTDTVTYRDHDDILQHYEVNAGLKYWLLQLIFSHNVPSPNKKKKKKGGNEGENWNMGWIVKRKKKKKLGYFNVFDFLREINDLDVLLPYFPCLRQRFFPCESSSVKSLCTHRDHRVVKTTKIPPSPKLLTSVVARILHYRHFQFSNLLAISCLFYPCSPLSCDDQNHEVFELEPRAHEAP